MAPWWVLPQPSINLTINSVIHPSFLILPCPCLSLWTPVPLLSWYLSWLLAKGNNLHSSTSNKTTVPPLPKLFSLDHGGTEVVRRLYSFTNPPPIHCEYYIFQWQPLESLSLTALERNRQETHVRWTATGIITGGRWWVWGRRWLVVLIGGFRSGRQRTLLLGPYRTTTADIVWETTPRMTNDGYPVDHSRRCLCISRITRLY